jgi:hypothetical protein
MLTKFLNLDFFKCRNFEMPEYLKPTIGERFLGVKQHYIDLSQSDYGDLIFKQFNIDSDEELMETLINVHGVFFEKFLASQFNHRVRSFFTDEVNSNLLFKSYQEYYKKNGTRNSIIDRIKDDFKKTTITRFKNDTIYLKLQKFEIEKSKPQVCPICNNYYKPINLPDWVYYGSNGNCFICYECPVVKNPKKRDLKILMSDLLNKLGFIPNADFNPINHNFSSRVKREQWIDVCRIIFEMGITGNNRAVNPVISKKFGSWLKALVEFDLLPNGVLKTSRGYRCIAKSGNECNSLDEMFIDNWMFENELNPIKEPIYPYHPIFNKFGKRRADWKIGDYYVEYFGLDGDKSYDVKTKEKIQLVSTLNLKLISIFPSDLNDISKKFDVLL